MIKVIKGETGGELENYQSLLDFGIIDQTTKEEQELVKINKMVEIFLC